MQLTIAIPTYNRIDSLTQTIAVIAPQMTAECQLVILDNHSSEPVSDCVHRLIQQYPEIRISYVRHPVNIGGAANVLRCVEICDTDWVWLLSDDDIVKPDAVATVLRTLHERPGCAFVNFAMPTPIRASDIKTKGCAEFVRNFDSMRHLTLISNDLFNIPKVRGFLKLAHQYTYSSLPHVALALASLGNDGEAFLAKESIIAGNADNPANPGWSLIHLVLGRMSLAELPMDFETQKALANKILADMEAHEAVTLCLAAQALKSGDSGRAVFLYDAYTSRNFYFRRSIIGALKSRFYRWLVRFPKLTRWLVFRFLPFKIDWFNRMSRYDAMERL